jgi:HAD superfamily hydrolase (TIGR01509 family)
MSKAVIFDIDGTLIDSVDAHARAWQDAFRDFNHALTFDEIRQQIGKGGDQLMPVFLAQTEIAAQGKDLENHRSRIFKERYLPAVRAFPDVRALFLRLRDDGVRIALASSAKKDEVEVYKKIAGIQDLVEVETSSDDAEKSKPHPDIFVATLARLGGIQPRDVIVVGDTPYDMEAARKARVPAVGVLCGGFPEASLRQMGCIGIYRGPAHLLSTYDISPLRRDSPAFHAISDRTPDGRVNRVRPG